MRVKVAPQAATHTSSTLSHPLSTNKLCLPRSLSFVALGSSTPYPSSPSKLSIRRSYTFATFDGPDFTRKHNTPFKKTTSFRSPQLDVLEPSNLGISPEPPQWPAREAVIRECIARRASRIELPLSLRMIKLKQRIQRENGELSENDDDNTPISNLCNSTLHIIKEFQHEAWRIRSSVMDEDLERITSRVQKELSSSFVWLFREVFSKTPDLMVQVMVLTSNFAVNSLETGQLELAKEESEGANEMKGIEKNLGLGFVDDNHVNIHEEIDGLKEDKFELVSGVRVDIEGDEYGEYYHTNLVYQLGLTQDPNNTLLLSNYAQFLWLVSRDYDRAEECFKHAVQLDTSDAEVASQYANFLWLVRNDLWGAEERYQQAMAAEPENPFHASKYASFLWNTGGEDTCYPLDTPQACAE